jgi:hypothetical protein
MRNRVRNRKKLHIASKHMRNRKKAVGSQGGMHKIECPRKPFFFRRECGGGGLAAQERSRSETAHRGRATWCSRAKTAASTPPAAVPHRTRDTKRDTRKLNGECSVVEGPSGVSTGVTFPPIPHQTICTGTTKAKVHCAVTSVIQSPTRLRISGPWGRGAVPSTHT